MAEAATQVDVLYRRWSVLNYLSALKEGPVA